MTNRVLSLKERWELLEKIHKKMYKLKTPDGLIGEEDIWLEVGEGVREFVIGEDVIGIDQHGKIHDESNVLAKIYKRHYGPLDFEKYYLYDATQISPGLSFGDYLIKPIKITHKEEQVEMVAEILAPKNYSRAVSLYIKPLQ